MVLGWQRCGVKRSAFAGYAFGGVGLLHGGCVLGWGGVLGLSKQSHAGELHARKCRLDFRRISALVLVMRGK